MSLLLEVLVFLIAAIVVVPLGRRLGLSSVLGYLITGVLIGPGGLGLVTGAHELLHFAELGVVLLLFIIGLELHPRRLWVMRRLVFGLGAAQVVTTAAAITGGLVFSGLPWPTALVVGFALALSSTAFVLQLLGERKRLYHAHGRAAFGVLLLQDVAVIPPIAILSALAVNRAGGTDPDMGSGFDPWLALGVIAGLVATRFLLRPVLRFVASAEMHELFSAASLALVVGAAVAMGTAGLSMGLGAFVAGMMVADSEYRHQLETDVTPFKGLLLGLFFIAVGMATDLRMLAGAPLTIVGLTVALVGVKALLLYPLARWHRLAPPEALRTALVLSQGGEFAFVLLTAGVGAGLVERASADLAVLVVTLSMATTPALAALADRMLGRADERPFDRIDGPVRPVVIAGFGRFGQIVSRVLLMRHIPFTALEINPSQVDFVRSFGNEIYFGDATRLDLLRSAHVGEARALVVAVDDVDAALKITERVRETCPNVTILARARSRQHEIRLREHGAHYVIRDTLLSSLELTTALLEVMGLSRDEAHASVQVFRDHDRRTLEGQQATYHDDEAYRRHTLDAAEELKSLFAEDAGASDRKRA